MDLPSDEEDAAEYSEEDVLYDADQAEGEDEEKWGRSKKAFYSADGDAVEEEAAEAKKLQKKRLAAMKNEDFTGGKQISSVKKSGVVDVDLSETESESEDSDNETGEEESGEEEFELSEEQVASLTADEKIELLSAHSDEFASLVTDFKERLSVLEGQLQPLISTLKSLPTSEGLSFLKVKYQLMTAYCTNVAFYLQLKLKGKSVTNHPVLTKLVRFRLLLEKLRPLETKLRHQVDRLLKAATGQVADEDAEATKFRPNPDMLLRADGQESEDEEADEDGVYKAPKLQAMHYPEDESSVARRTKHEEHLRKIAANSRLVQDIRAELEDAPEEESVDAVYGGKSRHGRREHDEREAYEEENYVRFTLDKKAKRRLKEQSKVVDELEDLNDFIDEIAGSRKKKASAVKKVEQKPAVTEKKQKRSSAQFDDESDIEDDFYGKTKAAKKAKSMARSAPVQKGPVKFRPIVDTDSSSARPANYKMLKNKGLTANRPKETKNPRVKQRMKYERAEKRIGSFKAVHKGQAGKYGGEDSGIRTNLVRSTKF